MPSDAGRSVLQCSPVNTRKSRLINKAVPVCLVSVSCDLRLCGWGTRMTINRLLGGSKLAPEQIEILNKAFDRALRALHLVGRGDPICEMVARTIIEVAKKWHARSRRDCRGNCKAAWAALRVGNECCLSWLALRIVPAIHPATAPAFPRRWGHLLPNTLPFRLTRFRER